MTTAARTQPGAPRLRLHGLPWVTWRQHRVALAGVGAVLGGLAVGLLVNGVLVRSAYTRLGLDTCGPLGGSGCRTGLGLFVDQYGGWAHQLPRFTAFLPAALGMFVGAPLVARELETGSFRFAWTQGRSRGQWVLVKLLLLGAVLAVATLAFSVWVGWWSSPWLPLMGRMSPGQLYESSGVVFAARTLFAFTLGALLGTVIRRTVPAMAATGVLWVGVVWASILYLRPLIQAPLEVPASSTLITRGGWSVAQWVQNSAGQRIDVKSGAYADLLLKARADGASGHSVELWLAQHSWTTWAAYQPDDRFWRFQALEAGCYLLVALLLGAVTVWLVRRRAS